MATLGEIRKRSGLLLAVIGFAMLAFILTDFMSSLGSGGGNSIYVGEVLGEDIMHQAYAQKIEEGINNWKSQNQQAVLTQAIRGQIRQQMWDQYVREIVMDNEYLRLGIDVSDDEFFELLQGVNVHPQISQVPAFQDQNTGIFDRSKVLGYLKQIDQDQTGEARTRWLTFQEYLIGLIKNAKYNTLISKSMYVTDQEALESFNEGLQTSVFNYVAIPFNSISDSLVYANDSEIVKYYKKHKSDYKQEASNDIDFVVFEVTPSSEDEQETRSVAEDLKSDFAIFEDYDLMARRNSDNTSARFIFSTKDKLQDPKWQELFLANQGSVIGPYKYSQGVYRIAKLVDVQNRPDSVEARHILIRPNQDMDLDSVSNLLESIKSKIQNGSDFGDLAQKHSEDKGSAIKGGDLGWFQEGAMVDEFNEVCFSSNIGSLNIVKSQFGVHLTEVTRISQPVRKIKIAFIDRNIEPSTETFNRYYSQAAQFTGKILNQGIAFDSLVVSQNLRKRSDSKVLINKQSIAGLPNSREVVRWANSSSEGQISEVFRVENSYVVAYLKKKNLEGLIPLDDIREEISALVVKEKKGEFISKSIQADNLEGIAANQRQKVIQAKTANLSDLSIQGVGYEPELVGAIFAANSSSISIPIKGQNAVYVAEVISKDDFVSSFDKAIQKKQELQQGYSAYSIGAVYNVLKTKADIKDNRSDFY